MSHQCGYRYHPLYKSAALSCPSCGKKEAAKKLAATFREFLTALKDYVNLRLFQ